MLTRLAWQKEKPKRRRGRPRKIETRSEVDERCKEDSGRSERGKREPTKKSGETQGEGKESLQAEAVKWLSCINLNPVMWKEAQDSDTALGKFAQLKKEGVKPGYDEIFDQGTSSSLFGHNRRAWS